MPSEVLSVLRQRGATTWGDTMNYNLAAQRLQETFRDISTNPAELEMQEVTTELDELDLFSPELGMPEAPEIGGNWGSFAGDALDFSVDGGELVGTGLDLMDVATVSASAGVSMGEVFSIVMLPLGATFGLVMQVAEGGRIWRRGVRFGRHGVV